MQPTTSTTPQAAETATERTDTADAVPDTVCAGDDSVRPSNVGEVAASFTELSPERPFVVQRTAALNFVKSMGTRTRQISSQIAHDERLAAAASQARVVADRAKTVLADDHTKEILKKGAAIGVAIAGAALVEHSRKQGNKPLEAAAEDLIKQYTKSRERQEPTTTETSSHPREADLPGDDGNYPRTSRPADEKKRSHQYPKPIRTLARWTTARHPELPQVSVEDSIGLQNIHYLTIESPAGKTRVVLEVAELENNWWVARHAGHDLALQLRVNSDNKVEFQFLEPTAAQRQLLAGDVPVPDLPSLTKTQMSDKMRAMHNDVRAVQVHLKP